MTVREQSAGSETCKLPSPCYSPEQADRAGRLELSWARPDRGVCGMWNVGCGSVECGRWDVGIWKYMGIYGIWDMGMKGRCGT